MHHDAVDTILAQWQRERPDLDPSPIGVIGRLSRVAQHLEQAIDRELQNFGISSGEFDVLATLRRSGAPYQLTPTSLFRSLMLSSGAMTNRIDRLERAGWVQRTPDPTDRRSTLVGLTDAGVELINRAVAAHLANEQRLLTPLSDDQQTQLRDLLRVMLRSFEPNDR